MKKSFKEIETLLLPIVRKEAKLLGYSLVKLSYVYEFSEDFLKIVIDSPSGIETSDLENFSNALCPILDKLNYLPNNYFLVISQYKPEHRCLEQITP